MWWESCEGIPYMVGLVELRGAEYSLAIKSAVSRRPHRLAKLMSVSAAVDDGVGGDDDATMITREGRGRRGAS